VTRVTLGVPVYEGARYLAETLAALRAQTHDDLEILVADNDSRDGSREIAEAAAAADPRVRVLTADRNRGAAWNYNRLVDAASGDYFKWAAADDLCRPELVARCAAELDRHPEACLAYPQTALIDAAGAPLGDYADGLHLVADSPATRFRRVVRDVRLCNAVFGLLRRAVLLQTRRIGPYPSSDLVLLGELALRGTFREVPGRLFLRRMHPAQSVSAHPENRQRVAWFDPDGPPGRRFPAWRLWAEFGRAVRGGPLRGRERLRAWLALGWWPRNKYGELLGDLWRRGRS